MLHLLTLPEELNSHPIHGRVLFARSVVLCEVLCRSLSVPFLLSIALSVPFWFTALRITPLISSNFSCRWTSNSNQPICNEKLTIYSLILRSVMTIRPGLWEMRRILSPSEYPMVKPAGKLHNKYRPVGYDLMLSLGEIIRCYNVTNLLEQPLTCNRSIQVVVDGLHTAQDKTYQILPIVYLFSCCYQAPCAYP